MLENCYIKEKIGRYFKLARTELIQDSQKNIIRYVKTYTTYFPRANIFHLRI